MHYKFKVVLDSSAGLAVTADGSTSLRYVEYPNGEAEKRSKQTKFIDGDVKVKVKFDSKAGEFCYSATVGAAEFKTC